MVTGYVSKNSLVGLKTKKTDVYFKINPISTNMKPKVQMLNIFYTLYQQVYAVAVGPNSKCFTF